MKIEHAEPENPEETTILIEGLEQGTTLMHLTDCHFVEWDERDPEARESAEQYQLRFQELTPGKVLARQRFRETLELTPQLGVEGLVLTGDIIHLPTLASLDALEQEIDALNMPHLYALGNHDWYFPYLEWNEATRASFYPRFHRLMDNDPACQVRELNGLLLVGLDNSNYQVSPAQVEVLRAQLQTGRPCLLFMHMPLWIPSLIPDVMERWEAPIVMAAQEGWTEETRARWQVRDNDPATQACYELLTEGEADNLAGIFCGHVHFAHADAFREGRFQYVTREGFAGGYRVIRIEPCS